MSISNQPKKAKQKDGEREMHEEAVTISVAATNNN